MLLPSCVRWVHETKHLIISLNFYYFKINFKDADGIEETPASLTYAERMFFDKILTDVKIVTADDKTILAHKCVLARSPVFLAMFQNEMIEKQQGEVHVKNIKHRVMKEMIYFMYTSKVHELDSIAGDLVVAADYYDLPDLKEIAIKSLEGNINLENFAHSLYIAERFELKSLKETVLRYVVG